ncbi:MAG: NADase-type glycan-binding domain-containing protein [Luteolibacter sp.]|jgi:hypothetical protein
MKRISMVLIGVFLTGGGLAWGNGGGYYRPGVGATGAIAGFEPVATEHVRIVDETLIIRAGRESAKVEVRYLMRNMSDKRVKVRFGFPIEETRGQVWFDQPPHQNVPKAHQEPVYSRNYQITARGKALRVNWQDEKNPEGDGRFNGLKGWNVSEITFAKGEEIAVTVQFVSMYAEKGYVADDTTSREAGVFRYRLSTAACWHGTIAEGRVIIEADGIDPADIRVIKPVNRFKKDGDRWIWNFKDLEPTLDDDLEIECQPAVNIYQSQSTIPDRYDVPNHLRADYIDRGGRWSMIHSNYQVKASSTLAPEGEYRYDATNIRDVWEDNAWSEGAKGNGVGEWLELTPAAAKPLIDIRIKPGYQKTTDRGLDLFTANARPKNVRVELNGEHRFDVEIQDREEEVVIPVRGYDKAVRKIRLTFTEVYPGELFDDMCVTTVRLHARLDREPQIQPER